MRRLVVAFPDAWLSRTHARLVWSRDRWHIEDARSKNRTFVNGLPVGRTPLVDGDTIRLGRSFLVYREENPVRQGEAARDGALLLSEFLIGTRHEDPPRPSQ